MVTDTLGGRAAPEQRRGLEILTFMTPIPIIVLHVWDCMFNSRNVCISITNNYFKQKWRVYDRKKINTYTI